MDDWFPHVLLGFSTKSTMELMFPENGNNTGEVCALRFGPVAL